VTGRVELLPGDIDQASGRTRLSYRQAEELFKTTPSRRGMPLRTPYSWQDTTRKVASTAGSDTRHSALTDDAQNGASAPMPVAKSRHTPVALLARYVLSSARGLVKSARGRLSPAAPHDRGARPG
jgi:hypothetical protein